MYDKNMLGYYNRGQQIPNTVVTNINGPIAGVMFPTIVAFQNDLERVKGMTRRSVVTSSFIVFPLMSALAAVSRPLTIILLTEKWLSSVPFMQLSCLLYAFYPMHTVNLQAISAIGRSDIFLKLEIIKKIVLIIIIAISAPFGIYAMISGSAVASIICTVINAYPNKRILNYGFKEQWIDIIPSLILSLTMGVIMYLLQFINLNEWVTLGIQGIFGIAYYFIMAYVLKFECFMYLINAIKVKLITRTVPYTP
jgi:O-antigen/teichoic acid export membrane protein